MKGKKRATISITYLIVITISLVVLFFILGAFLKKFNILDPILEIPNPNEPDPNNPHLDVLNTEPEVYVGSGWLYSDKKLVPDENDKYWINIIFDFAITDENFKNKIEIYRDGWGVFNPSKREEWIRYDILMEAVANNKNIIDLGEWGGQVTIAEPSEFPMLSYLLSDDKKSLTIGPFPTKGAMGNYLFLIKFKYDKEKQNGFYTTYRGFDYVINPDRDTIKFLVP